MKYLTILFLFFMASCQTNTDPTQSKMDIARVIFNQQNAWNNGDINGYMQGYLKSDSLRFASGGNVTYGWESTLDRYQKGYPDIASMGKLIFSDIDIQLISNDAAIVFGKWELERESDHPWGLFTLVFNKTENGWCIVHDHTSSAKEN